MRHLGIFLVTYFAGLAARGAFRFQCGENAFRPIAGLAASAICTTTVYVETTSEGKGKNAGTFEPKVCVEAETVGDPLTNTIALNDGVKMFDAATATKDLLLGPVGSIQLAPQGCP